MPARDYFRSAPVEPRHRTLSGEIALAPPLVPGALRRPVVRTDRAAPRRVEPAPSGWRSFADFLEALRGFKDQTALSFYKHGTWRTVTYAQLVAEVERRARFLLSLELVPRQSKVALISESNPDWVLWAFGVLRAGLVLVPLDYRCSPAEVAGLIAHSEAELLIHSDQVRDQLAELDRAGTCEARLNLDAQRQLPDFRDIALGNPQPEDTAVITYTSGTFAQAKGVMTSFRALLFQAAAGKAMAFDQVGDTYLSHLPMNHLYEFTALFIALSSGCELIVCERVERELLRFHFAHRKVKKLYTVPLLLETLERSIRKTISEKPWLPRWLFAVLYAVAALPLPLGWRRRAFRKIHDAFGGVLERAISGGAPLRPGTARFFKRVGIPVYQGYGMTETGPVISVNRFGQLRLGTVGPPLAGVEVKIASPDQRGIGEIRTRGPHLMLGYFKAPSLTREAFDDEGYLKTGDLGFIDAHGHLRITGRIKKLIVLQSGKKVHAEEVEAVASGLPFVTAACAFALAELSGPGADGVGLAVSVDPQWMPSSSAADRIRAARTAVEGRLKVLAAYKRPAQIFVLEQELPKTATQKVIPPRVLKLLKETRATP